MVKADEIIMTCKGCGEIHTLMRTPEIPDRIENMGCNWCPDCQDNAREDYREWHSRKPKIKLDDQLALGI